MNGHTPTKKVGAGALAGAVSVIAVWALQQTGVNMPAEISSAFTTLLTFATSWYVADQ